MPTGTTPQLPSLLQLDPSFSLEPREILDKYDVRYVVFYKRMPPHSELGGKVPEVWKKFLLYPNLYQKAFENKSVIVFKVLPSTPAATSSDARRPPWQGALAMHGNVPI